MARTRITENDVHIQMNRVSRMMSAAAGHEVRMTLYLGNSSHKETNKLLVDGQNVWLDGMAGTSTREAWNALRLMAATLGTSTELREQVRGNVR